MTGPIVAVVGMKREARIVGARAAVCQRGAGLEEALRNGGSAVISFGLCGALDPGLSVGDLVLGEAVTDGETRYDCDPEWTAALAETFAGARRGLFWADGRMISGVKQKQALLETTGAIAVDMESHLAARAAAEYGVPFAIVRSVSDCALTAIPATAQAAFAADGSIDALAAAKRLVQGGLRDLQHLFAMARDAGHAFRAREAVVPSPAMVRL